MSRSGTETVKTRFLSVPQMAASTCTSWNCPSRASLVLYCEASARKPVSVGKLIGEVPTLPRIPCPDPPQGLYLQKPGEPARPLLVPEYRPRGPCAQHSSWPGSQSRLLLGLDRLQGVTAHASPASWGSRGQGLVSVGEVGGADRGIFGAGTLTGVTAGVLWSEGRRSSSGKPFQVRGLTLQVALGSSLGSPGAPRDSGVPKGLPHLLPRDLLAGRGPSPPHLLGIHPRLSPPALRLTGSWGPDPFRVSQGLTHRAPGLQVGIPM